MFNYHSIKLAALLMAGVSATSVAETSLTAYTDDSGKVVLTATFPEPKNAIYLSRYTNGSNFNFTQISTVAGSNSNSIYEYVWYSNLDCPLGTQYSFRLQANGAGFHWAPGPGDSNWLSYTCEEPSEPQPPARAPQVTVNTDVSSISLSWAAVDGADAYRVYYGIEGSGADTLWSDGSSLFESVTGLQSETSYDVKVEAYNSVGSVSGNVQTVATAADIPPQLPEPAPVLGAEAGNALVDLSWQASEYADGYRVLFGIGQTNQQFANTAATNIQVTGLTNDVEYSFQVVAFNTDGEIESNTVTATPEAPYVPQPPINAPQLSTEAGDGQVMLNWTASDFAEGYDVYYRLNGAQTLAGTITDTEFLVDGLINDETYEFSVEAFNVDGVLSGDWVAATPKAVTLPDPGNSAKTLNNLTASVDAASNQVTLTVIFNDAKQAIYLSSYRNNQNFNFRQINPDSETQNSNGTFTYTWVSDLLCEEGVTHNLRLQANGSTFEWAPGPGDNVYLDFDCSPQEPQLPTPAPQVSGVSKDGQVELSWTVSNGATGYQVNYGFSGETLNQVINADGQLAISIYGLTNDQAYDFVVVASNEVGEISSNPITLTPTFNQNPVDDIKILVFSKTTGWRHGSIPSGKQMFNTLGASNQWLITETEDSNVFNGDLSQYQVIVFNNTTGDILNPTQEQNFKAWLENGGGFLAIHAAVDTEADWDWYHDTVLGGARFIGHPDDQQRADLILEEASEPFLNHIGTTGDVWNFYDEWYFWDIDLRESPFLEVVARLDRTSYPTTVQPADADHPAIFTNLVSSGKVYYTVQGHRNDTFNNTDFQQQIVNVIEWMLN